MYKLAENIELIDESIEHGRLQYIVAVYNAKYKDFVVNKITFEFLQHFKNPNTLASVTDEYFKLTKATEAQKEHVTSQLSSFFNDLVKKGWIVEQNHEVKKIAHDTFYNTGDFISTYKILKILSNNNLTDVYLVKLPDSRKKYVIKYLNPLKFRREARYNRYQGYIQNEFFYLKKFNSIYINKGVEFQNSPNNCYMVLQFIDGKSLYRYLKHNRLSTANKITLVSKILKGFSLIHSNSIYHGDIHLSNILVTPNRQVKIIDFGYSNPAEERESENQKIRNGGVHAFIPPERALRSITRKFNAVQQFQSEVYQLGLILYYVFVRELPFAAETWKTMVDEKKTFNIHENEPFLKRRMPKKIRQIISKSLENNPSGRYNNANSMLVEWKNIKK